MSNDAELQFWHWSLDTYRDQNVANALLYLQDHFGFNVNICLWCCWYASFFGEAPDYVLRRAIATTDQWNSAVTTPLRGVRRFLKTAQSPSGADNKILRNQIKEIELQSEKLEQIMLQKITDDDERDQAILPEAAASFARRNLAQYAAIIKAHRQAGFSVALLGSVVQSIFASD